MSISAEQRVQLAVSLIQKIDWSQLTVEQIQVGIRDEEKRVGPETTAFILNGFRIQVGDFFRETGELAIEIPALPHPTLAELREKYSWIREENGIERDTSPTEAVTLKLGTVLRADESSIDDPEYEKRIAPKLPVALGYQQAVWVVEYQDEFPALMALLDKVYIDFRGLVVVDARGRRRFPFLKQNGESWSLNWNWIENDLNSNGRIAVAGNSQQKIQWAMLGELA